MGRAFSILSVFSALSVTVMGCQSVDGGSVGGVRLPEPDSLAASTYRGQCSRCHSLPHPSRHTFEGWQHYIQLMQKRMQERGLEPMEPEKKQRILAYLKEHSR